MLSSKTTTFGARAGSTWLPGGVGVPGGLVVEAAATRRPSSSQTCSPAAHHPRRRRHHPGLPAGPRRRAWHRGLCHRPPADHPRRRVHDEPAVPGTAHGAHLTQKAAHPRHARGGGRAGRSIAARLGRGHHDPHVPSRYRTRRRTAHLHGMARVPSDVFRTRVSATATNPPPRERDRPSPNRGHSASSDRGRRRAPGSDQLAPATPGVGSIGNAPDSESSSRTGKSLANSGWRPSVTRHVGYWTRPDLRCVELGRGSGQEAAWGYVWRSSWQTSGTATSARGLA